MGRSCFHTSRAARVNFLASPLRITVVYGSGVAWVCCLKENLSLSLPSTMALQQAQMLLSMNSLESLSAGVQQNNTESFAVALCHLAELHAEQVGRLSLFVLCCHGKIPAETNLKEAHALRQCKWQQQRLLSWPPRVRPKC